MKLDNPENGSVTGSFGQWNYDGSTRRWNTVVQSMYNLMFSVREIYFRILKSYSLRQLWGGDFSDD